ncbi:MAG: phenylacetate--CoA ligase family protein [Acidimicrobiales bacterium]
MPTYPAGGFGPQPRDPGQLYWDPEMQTMPREQLRMLQTARLRTFVGKVLAGGSPLFGRKLADAGITAVDDISDVDDINQIPTTVKQDLRESEAALPPFGDYRFSPREDCVRLGSSTGTTGTPTLTLWTRHDIWLEYESAARVWWRYGWRPGQIVTHAHPAYLYGGGVMLSGCLEYFGLLNLWVAPPDTDELAEQGIRMWERVHPEVSMVAFSMGRFVEVAQKLGVSLADDCGLPNFQLHGFGKKGLPIMTCGVEAYAYVGGPCTQGEGGHVHEDWSIVQAVDPATGRDKPDGEWGNLVVTTLDRDNGLLRYDLEEAACIIREPCGCGETTIRGFWGGRFKDLLASQGKHFQINELEGALRSVEAVTKPTLEWQVVKPVDDTAPLRVRVELAEGDADIAAGACAAAIERETGVKAIVEVVPRETLTRSGYKQTRLVDS